MLKSDLREIIRNRKRQFTRQQLEELSFAVISRLKRHPRFVSARTLLLYHSLPDEVYTHRLMTETEDRTLLLPQVVGNGEMKLRIYTGAGDMREGLYHIMEPCGEIFDRYDEIDLAVIPGVAFDNKGHRLGRGKGYYDRFLPLIPKAYKIGICFSFQIVDNVPTEYTDIKMDEIVC